MEEKEMKCPHCHEELTLWNYTIEEDTYKCQNGHTYRVKKKKVRSPFKVERLSQRRAGGSLYWRKVGL
jgi:hypothetical protein